MAPERDGGKDKLVLVDSGVYASSEDWVVFLILVTYIRMILLGFLNHLPFTMLFL